LSFLSDEELEAILAAHLRGRDEDFELSAPLSKPQRLEKER
jgi:hypothetical protein